MLGIECVSALSPLGTRALLQKLQLGFCLSAWWLHECSFSTTAASDSGIGQWMLLCIPFMFKVRIQQLLPAD
jgi:hypothetical protein